MHKVFISHHHQNDQSYKESLSRFGEENGIFLDRSVDTGDISEEKFPYMPSRIVDNLVGVVNPAR